MTLVFTVAVIVNSEMLMSCEMQEAWGVPISAWCEVGKIWDLRVNKEVHTNTWVVFYKIVVGIV